jgi:hypothetical protein
MPPHAKPAHPHLAPRAAPIAAVCAALAPTGGSGDALAASVARVGCTLEVVLRSLLLAALLVSALAPACSNGSEGADLSDTVPDASLDADTTAPDAAPEIAGDATPDAAPDADAEPDAPTEPPLTRPERGEPVSASDLATVTDQYLELLEQTRYFQVVDERAHGWPQSDPAGRYWYATWWSGVKVEKSGGQVTYRHSDDGADNNGMRTAPILQSVCYAELLWGGQDPLLRRLTRGMASWALAMEREPAELPGALLCRAAYPESVVSEDGGRTVFIDTSLDRPGIDGDASSYVHNPDNPYWGDIWIKNKRSKDDIGHMLQVLAYLPTCADAGSAGLKEDAALVETLYAAWARRVEDDDFRIVSVDADWQEFFPKQDLAFYVTLGGVECPATLALRLYGRGDAGEIDCGQGLTDIDEAPGFKNDVGQILRSHHEAAAAQAERRGLPALARQLQAGLAWRLDTVLDAREGPTPATTPNDQDVAELLLMSAAAGTPLTWRDVRFLHARIADAHAGFLTPAMAPHYRVFDSATPDGSYAFTPEAAGFFWRYLGAALGTCASPYRNPTSKPVLDCDRVRAATARFNPAR